MPMRIFITGAAGFVGAATARAALEKGYEVHALTRRTQAPRLAALAGNLHMHIGDLSKSDAITRLLMDIKPDIVIHCAWEGVGGAARAEDIQFDNIKTSLTILDAAIAAGVRKFVGIGSQAEYGRYDRRITEDDLPQPTMLYGAAKLSAYHLTRQRARDAGMAFAWLRLFSVYGPSDNQHWLIPSVAASLMRGIAPECTLGVQAWDYLHIDDVAAGTLAAAITPGALGVFNLSSGAPITVRAVIEKVRDLAAPGLPLSFGAIPYGPDQIMHLEGDNNRLKTATGWAPAVQIADGLAHMIVQLQQAA